MSLTGGGAVGSHATLAVTVLVVTVALSLAALLLIANLPDCCSDSEV